jgi:hypothetical protein
MISIVPCRDGKYICVDRRPAGTQTPNARTECGSTIIERIEVQTVSFWAWQGDLGQGHLLKGEDTVAFSSLLWS